MKSHHCEWRDERGREIPICLRTQGYVSIVRQLSLLLLISFSASALLAQSTGGLECPDQLLGINSGCSGSAQDAMQLQQEAQSAFGASSAHPVSDLGGSSGNPGDPNYSGNRPGSYSDLEQWTRMAAAQQAPAPQK